MCSENRSSNGGVHLREVRDLRIEKEGKKKTKKADEVDSVFDSVCGLVIRAYTSLAKSIFRQ